MLFIIDQGLFQYNIRDHHAILGVSLDANDQEIRKQYLKIARLIHPDTCKFSTDREKNLANSLFSRLVSPANKQISTLQLRTEHLCVVERIAKKITEDSNFPVITSEDGKKLLEADVSSLHLVYRSLINKISETQYAEVEEVVSKIGQISQINLVYIIQKRRHGSKWEGKNSIMPNEYSATESVNSYIKRAKQYIEQNLPIQAITELKEVLKHDPSNAIAHALTGIAYLKQNQFTMAKIHINKSMQLGAQDALVIKAKEALDKFVKESDSPKSDNGREQSSKKNNEIFKNIFGGKKE